jgi:hypothetical protein
MIDDESCSDERYIFKVQGELHDNLKDYFDGFSIETEGNQIILTGPVPDFSALMGLLERIYMLDLKLDSLIRVIQAENDKNIRKGGK